MSQQKLHIGFGDYDRTRVLANGTVKIEGADVVFDARRIVTDVFEGMVKGKYDVAELGLSYFLRTMDFPDAPFLALPIFPVRCFRHSAIYVNVNSGIKTPEDLKGKTIGEFAMYGHDAGVWPKGILSDDFGVRPEDCRWVVGALDWPLKPVDFVPQPHPDNVQVTHAPAGTDLGALLEKGEIDALISADIPKCMLEKSPHVAHLFEDPKATERDYFRRTKIFPIMHTLAVRKDVIQRGPGLVRAVYKGFVAAKNAVHKQYTTGMIFNNMQVMVPWVTQLIDENKELMGDDWWPEGLKANRQTVDTFLRYHKEQGLSKRRWTCEDIFAPDYLDT